MKFTKSLLTTCCIALLPFTAMACSTHEETNPQEEMTPQEEATPQEETKTPADEAISYALSMGMGWNLGNIHLTVEQLESVQPGATIRVYYEMIDAEYHAMRVTSNWWEYDFVSQFDITAETPNPFEFEFTSEHQQKAQEQEGMLVVGFGYRVSKIAYK